MFVRSWMSSPAVVLADSTSMQDALEFMELRKIRRVPVIREGKVVGIVTRGDLQSVMGSSLRSGRPVYGTIGERMTRSVFSVPPDETLERASQMMLRNQISGLPVIEGDRVVGIITESDIFAAFNEIMGTSESGARLVLAIPPTADLLESIRKQLGGLAIRSLATYRKPAGGWEVVVRVCGRSPAVTQQPILPSPI